MSKLPRSPQPKDDAEHLEVMAKGLVTCLHSGMSGETVAQFLPRMENAEEMIRNIAASSGRGMIEQYKAVPQVWQHLSAIPERQLERFFDGLVEGAKNLDPASPKTALPARGQET